MSQPYINDNPLEEYEFGKGQFLTPFQRKVLLKNLQTDLQPEYRRRIEIMLLADMGKSQTQICHTVGCSHEMARYWSAIAKAGLAHQWDEVSIGRPPLVNEQYIEKLKELVSRSPRDYGYPFHNWTGHWLSKHLNKEFGIEVTDRHINRLLKKMGLSTRKNSHSTQQNTSSQESGITIYDLKLPDLRNSDRQVPVLERVVPLEGTGIKNMYVLQSHDR